MHNNANMLTDLASKNWQFHANVYSFQPVSKFRGFYLKHEPSLLISRIRAPHWKNALFSRKWVRAWMYALVGSGRTEVTTGNDSDDSINYPRLHIYA